MILTSHIIAASAIVAPLALKPLTIFNLAAIFFISFISHYLLDLIPHWDYKLSLWDFKEKGEKAILSKKNIIRDSVKIFIDFALGIIVGFWIIGLSVGSEGFFMLGFIVFASCLPDILQVSYIFWKKFPLVQLQKLHSIFHAKLKLNHQPVKGIAIQAIVLILIILFI